MYVDLGTRCRCIIGPVGKTARPPQVTLRYGPHRRAARTCSPRYGNAAWLANIGGECDPRLDVEAKRSFGSRGSGTCKMQHKLLEFITTLVVCTRKLYFSTLRVSESLLILR